MARCNIGRALMTLGRADQALSEYQQVRTVFRSAHGEQHPRMAIVLNAMAHAYLASAQTEQAADAAHSAHAIAATRWPDGLEILADSISLMAELDLQRGNTDQAAARAEGALAMLQARLSAPDWRIAACQRVLGEIRVEQGRIDEARELLLSAQHGLAAQFGQADPRARRSAERLAALDRVDESD